VNAPHLLKPNVADISAHLHALFPPAFVHHFPDAQIEIIYGPPGVFTVSRWFSAFDLKAIAGFAEVRNAHGDNIYVGAALRHGTAPEGGRANGQNYLAAQCAWCEYDGAGDHERIVAICKDKQLEPAIIVTTGTVPDLRQHLYFQIKGGIADAVKLKVINTRLRDLFGSDDVTDAIRIMRLAGCVNYPTEKKQRERDYVAELVTVKVAQRPREYSVEELGASRQQQHDRFDFNNYKPKSSLGFDFARSDDDIWNLLQASKKPGHWHKSIRAAIATMIGRGWSDDAIRIACGPYCDGGKDDPDLDPLIDGARQKWDKPNPDDGGASSTGSGTTGGTATLVATPWKWVNPEDVSPREFLYGTHYIRQFLSVGFGAPGGGKSTKRMVEAIAMASGKPLLGAKPVKKLKVWYWNGEDPQSETDRRFAAICKHYRIKPEEIEGYLFTNSGRDMPIVLAEQAKTGTKIAMPMVEQLKAAILAAGIDILIVDPFVACHRVTENDNNAIDVVAKQFSAIADGTNCAIDAEHHIRKTNGNEATVDDGRGASSLVGAARAIEVLNKMTKVEADKLGIDQHWRYLCVDDGKANMAPLGERKWFKLESIKLGNSTPLYPNGDDVGVVTVWAPSDPLDGVTGRDFDKVAAAIHAGRWRESSQAKNWVGIPVAKALRLDLASKADKAKVRALVQIWLKAGSLVVVEEPDANRIIRKFVKVADEA
jgi:hypothetical protein